MKKLTYKEYLEISGRCVPLKLARFYSYELHETSGGNYTINVYLKVIPYILLFIPAHVFEFIRCIWECGLKNFSFAERYIGNEWFSYGSERWEKADAIYNKGVDK